MERPVQVFRIVGLFRSLQDFGLLLLALRAWVDASIFNREKGEMCERKTLVDTSVFNHGIHGRHGIHGIHGIHGRLLGLLLHFLTTDLADYMNFFWLAHSLFTILNSPFKRSAKAWVHQALEPNGFIHTSPGQGRLCGRRPGLSMSPHRRLKACLIGYRADLP